MAENDPASGTPLPPGPFTFPIYRAVWIAALASNFGGMIQAVGAAWMMTALSPSPTIVALVQASQTLPILLLALVAGAIADNMDRRKVMLAAQSFMLAVSLALSVFAWMGWLNPWLLLVFTFLIGCGTALNGPSWQSSVGDMVSRPALPAAVAANSTGMNLARSTGPALGGLIVASLGAAAAFLANAASYIGLIVVLARWRPERPPRLLPPEPLLTAMGAGVRYVAMSPNIRVVLMRSVLFGIASAAVPALMPLVARGLLHGGAATYGMLSASFGAGAVIGALTGTRLRRRWAGETLVRCACLTLAMGTALLAISPYVLLSILVLVMAGTGWMIAVSTFNVTVQLAAPRWVVGRALSLYQMATFGGMAGGSWLFGVLAGGRGVIAALLIAGLVQAAAGLLGLLLPLPQTQNLNLDPLMRWTEPDLAVQIEPRSGPIVVTTEYRIAPADILQFLAAMNDRRRMRIRDGARNWTLQRDLGDPLLWIEVYHVPTWLDYVRHNHRRTHDDAAHGQHVRALHIGPEPPRVHRRIERQTASLPQGRSTGPQDMGDPLIDPSRST